MKRLFWIILLVALGTMASAQSRGSYFFENSLLRSKLNPAFAPKTDYASFPGVGSFSADMAGNVGLQHFLFPQGDANYLYLSDNVPAEQFLSGLPERDPYLQERVESDLFGFGMKVGQDGFATLSLSLVENGHFTVSGDLLRYTKSRSSVAKEFFEGGSADLAGYAALAAGYSRDLGSLVQGLRAGVRIKLLIGLSAGRFAVDRMGMQFSPDQVSATVHGTGALAGIKYGSADGLSLASPGLRSLGAAIDLGASYWLPIDNAGTLNGIELSASVCDLGGLRYRNDVSSLSLDHQFTFSGIEDLTGDVKAGFEQVIGDIRAFTEIDSSAGEPFFHRLPASIHIGATAHLWQDKANAGLLYYHAVGHSNVMVAGGVSPTQWLNLGVNWTFLGPANRLGCYAEFIPKKYFGVFLGMECASLRHNASHIPVRNFTESFAFGVNVLFGNNRGQ